MGKEIAMPFREDMKRATLGSRKNCTSRFRKYGNVGDFFKLDSRKFVIKRIDRYELGFVAKYLYRDEGMDSPEEFWKIWRQIHSKRTNPHLKVYVHWFLEAVNAV